MIYTKCQLLSQLNDLSSPFIASLYAQYANQKLLSDKLVRIKKMLETSELVSDEQTIIARCPGRISLSKHADYINNDLLYTLGDRDIYIAAQILDLPKLVLINSSEDFKNYEIDLDKLDHVDKASWAFYPAMLYRELVKSAQGMVLVYSSDLPAAGGLSSSHALMLSTAIAILGLGNQYDDHDQDHSLKTEQLIHLCQRVENARGFSSGLGDQSAQLLCQKNHFAFIKLFPKIVVEYLPLPENLAIVSAPSFIHADKSLPEFQAANANIQAYKKINELSHQYGCKYLGDLLYKFNDLELFEILEKIQDPLLRGLALYGLAEGARVRELKNSLNIQLIGAHLNLSHKAEQNYYYDALTKDWRALTTTEKLDYHFNRVEPISSHSGIYLASTIANDQLQYFTNNLRGVYGSSISGAGLGGNNTIICDQSFADSVRVQLLEGFYRQRGLEQEACDKVHISSSSAAAARII